MKQKTEPRYWICRECAEKKKWIAPDFGVTVIQGRCGYCKSEEVKMLTPIVDFKRGDIEPVWD